MKKIIADRTGKIDASGIRKVFSLGGEIMLCESSGIKVREDT